MSDRTGSVIDRISVVGAGTMGHGIATAFALAGHSTALFDVNATALDRAATRVDGVLDTFRTHGRIDDDEAAAARDRLDFDPVLESAVGGADLAIEAVAEDLEVKRDVFADLDRLTQEDAILATNTSGLSISRIAGAVDRPERVVGTHWFNPPYVVPLVEVIYGEETADETVDRVSNLLEAIGKTPVTVDRELPGFIANRIQIAMHYEAFSLLDRGVASAEAIDRAVRAGFGFRLPFLGIFEKVDHSGVDVEHAVESYLLPDLDRGTEPGNALTQLVEASDHGLKTGKGVYDWSDVDEKGVYERRDRALLDQLDLYEGTGELCEERGPKDRSEPP